MREYENTTRGWTVGLIKENDDMHGEPDIDDATAANMAARMAQKTDGVARHRFPPRAPLIVLEGIDGAGTTTQAQRLVEYLDDRSPVDGPPTHLTRQPSGGPIGRLLREMLAGQHRVPVYVQPPTMHGPSIALAPPCAETLATLFAADRHDHLQREVEPALERGEVVVSDRWYHSSFAYQGPHVGLSRIADLNHRVRAPDLTIFLRVSPEVALRRRVAAGRVPGMFDDLATQRQVADGYECAIDLLTSRGYAAYRADGWVTDDARERVEVVDGGLPEDEVHLHVALLVESLLSSWGAPK